MDRLPVVFAIANGDGTTENFWGMDVAHGLPFVHVLIEGCGTGDIVFVSILLMDERRTVRAIDRRPVTPIAAVPFDRGSQLCICVGKAGRRDVNEDAPSAILGSDEVGFATVVRASVGMTP